MEQIITHRQAGDIPGALPDPSPERLAQIFAFADRLFELYGEDRATWPDPGTWPWEMLDGGAR